MSVACALGVAITKIVSGDVSEIVAVPEVAVANWTSPPDSTAYTTSPAAMDESVKVSVSGALGVEVDPGGTSHVIAPATLTNSVDGTPGAPTGNTVTG